MNKPKMQLPVKISQNANTSSNNSLKIDIKK